MPYMQDAGQAIGQATENLGQAITGVADIGFKFVEKRRKIKDAKGMSAFFTNLDAQATEFENDLIKRQDYSNWTQDWQAKTDSWGSGIDALDISNDAKAEMKLKYNEWSGAKATRLSTTALLKDVETAKGTFAADLNYYTSRGDAVGAERVLSEMDNSQLYRADQKKVARMETEKSLFQTNVSQMVKENPDEAEKFVNSDAFMAQPGATTDLRDSTLNRIREQKRVRSTDSIDLYRDKVASGQYASAADIDTEWKGKVRPSVLEEMKDDFRRRTDANEKARLSSPEFQAELAGEASGLLDGMALSDDYEDRYAKASFNIDSLADSPLKRRLQEQLSAAKQGRTATIKNAQDAAFEGISQLAKSGRLGTLPKSAEVMSTDKALNDGFLKNKGKMMSLGFSEKQFNEIQNAENGSGKVTQQSQREKFQQLWEQRLLDYKTPTLDEDGNSVAPVSEQPAGGMMGRWDIAAPNVQYKSVPRKNLPAADGLTIATAEAIINGKSTVEYLTPEQTMENAKAAVNSKLREGKLLQEMNEFLISNPQSSSKDIDQKMFEIAGAEGRAAFQASKMNSFPTRGARSGDRITSYGYSGDTTPDSNSTAGIGAWVSDEEQKRIKRGEMTENRLREGDLAVSRDVERQFKAAGIKPRDKVRITLDDNTSMIVRWNDKTGESYNGKALTGRFDLYSPKGPSPLNGRSVTGWKKDDGTPRNTGEFEEYNVITE